MKSHKNDFSNSDSRSEGPRDEDHACSSTIQCVHQLRNAFKNDFSNVLSTTALSQKFELMTVRIRLFPKNRMPNSRIAWFYEIFRRTQDALSKCVLQFVQESSQRSTNGVFSMAFQVSHPVSKRFQGDEDGTMSTTSLSESTASNSTDSKEKSTTNASFK